MYVRKPDIQIVKPFNFRIKWPAIIEWDAHLEYQTNWFFLITLWTQVQSPQKIQNLQKSRKSQKNMKATKIVHVFKNYKNYSIIIYVMVFFIAEGNP